LAFLVLIMKIQQSESSKSYTKLKATTTKTEIDDLIEYLAKETDRSYREIMSKKSESEEPNFIETQALSQERGTGCEAFNKCSGKGTCNNGACLCDEGYDYFDCSVNLLSKII
jgi:hypothetical protein